MEIYCNNINNRQLGYVIFKVGDGSEAFDISMEEYEAILTGVSGAAASLPRGAGGASAWLLSALLSTAAAVMLSATLAGTP